MKSRPCEFLILPTLQYALETQSIKVVMKRLEIVIHKLQRNVLDISWIRKASNQEARHSNFGNNNYE